jgi:hypothetical protein
MLQALPPVTTFSNVQNARRAERKLNRQAIEETSGPRRDPDSLIAPLY